MNCTQTQAYCSAWQRFVDIHISTLMKHEFVELKNLKDREWADWWEEFLDCRNDDEWRDWIYNLIIFIWCLCWAVMTDDSDSEWANIDAFASWLSYISNCYVLDLLDWA